MDEFLEHMKHLGWTKSRPFKLSAKTRVSKTVTQRRARRTKSVPLEQK
jgi:hypothetical protein